MPTPSDPIGYLARLHRAGSHNDVVQMIRDRDSVLTRFGPAFTRPSGPSDDHLVDFLAFEHNRHWWGLQHKAEPVLGSPDLARALIAELLDESAPIDGRIDAVSGVAGFVPDLWSAILLVAVPDRYGVWSDMSESAMRRLGLWPRQADQGSTGSRYVAINDMLALVATEVGVDLWTLDALWWGVEKEHDPSRYFVTRRRPKPSPPVPSTRPRTTKTKVKVAGEDTFVCQRCWTTKPARLRSATTPGLCVDCG